ncbi:MAG: hypothetical protein U1F25_09700 [Rubrivivax sp.]
MHLLNADLHSHSTVSDGTLAPEAQVERAALGGVLWALTDHDEVGGQQRARQAALDLGLAWTGGVEVSVSFAGETVHIVGLGIDPEDEALRAGLAATRAGRARACQMAAGRRGRRLRRRNAPRRQPSTSSRALPRPLHRRAGPLRAHRDEVFRHHHRRQARFVPTQWARLADAVR